jgi:hypothetical protein
VDFFDVDFEKEDKYLNMVSAEGIESTIKRSFNDMQTADDIKKRQKTSYRTQIERV